MGIERNQKPPQEQLSPLGQERRDLLRGALAAAGALTISGVPLDAEAAQKKKNVIKAPKRLESAESNIAQRYTAAREYINRQRNPHGIFDVYYPLVDRGGEYRGEINIGALNTQGYRLIEEHGAYELIEDLGFTSVEEFAKAYNVLFPHRTSDQIAQLDENARAVESARLARRDIRIGDRAFQQVRLALSIYVADSRLQTPIEKTVAYGPSQFTVGELKKYNIVPQHILLAGEYDTTELRGLLDFIQSKDYSDLIRLAAPLRSNRTLRSDYAPSENENVKERIQSFMGRGRLDVKSVTRLSEIIEEFRERPGSRRYDAGKLLSLVWAKHPDLLATLQSYDRARSIICEHSEAEGSTEQFQEAFHCGDYVSGP
ncbi:hypothetical protein A3A41_04430 [Candidatus Kaiserbacteria bacterium RIFCSPLOWO2_01_FULL_54_22]|nr:MAG: hypothetical protein A3A41_04430 [Candidatus Kaiserbacteria bacterium RIFCSPLOWO2_01_FULL_54_22]